jgi:hypothetical protein
MEQHELLKPFKASFDLLHDRRGGSEHSLWFEAVTTLGVGEAVMVLQGGNSRTNQKIQSCIGTFCRRRLSGKKFATRTRDGNVYIVRLS